MKTLLAVTVLISAASAAYAGQGADPDKSKVRVYQVAKPDSDCKVSRKEIQKLDGTTAGRRYICIHLLTGDGEELTLKELASLIQTGKVALTYEGKDSLSLLDTLNTWKAWQIKDASQYTNSAERLMQIEPYSFVFVSNTPEGAAIRLQAANQAPVDFLVKMNVPAKDKKD